MPATDRFSAGPGELWVVDPVSGRRERIGEIPAEVRRRLAGDEWNESDHPRGQPNNAGQFSSSPGGSLPSYEREEEHTSAGTMTIERSLTMASEYTKEVTESGGNVSLEQEVSYLHEFHREEYELLKKSWRPEERRGIAKRLVSFIESPGRILDHIVTHEGEKFSAVGRIMKDVALRRTPTKKDIKLTQEFGIELVLAATTIGLGSEYHELGAALPGLYAVAAHVAHATIAKHVVKLATAAARVVFGRDEDVDREGVNALQTFVKWLADEIVATELPEPA